MPEREIIVMKKFKRTFTKYVAIVAIVLILAVSMAARKVYLYAADPVGEKNCPPLFPVVANDPSKPTTIALNRPGLTLPWAQKGGTINDASCLNKTSVYAIVQVTT